MPVDLWDLVESSANASPDDLPTVEEVVLNFSESTPVDTPHVSDYIDRRILSLDISQTSTGVFISGPKSYSYNLPPLGNSDSPYSETLMRREFKSVLLDSLPVRDFDLVAVEDVFVGHSAKVARSLYAINTGVDELILDNQITAKSFERVNNVSWKSAWSKWVGQGNVSSLKDKERVRAILSLAPYDFSQTCLQYLDSLNSNSAGYQDRLDAFAIGVSCLLPHLNHTHKVRWSEVCVEFATNPSDLYIPPGTLRPYLGALTRKVICSTLEKSHSSVFITPQPVHLGTLVSDPDPMTKKYLLFYKKG